MPLGVYISVPFCRSKCSFCNFASQVFPRSFMQRYVERVIADIENAEMVADSFGAAMERAVDTVYFGGGTPSTLSEAQLTELFAAIRDSFDISADAEITVECAPGTLPPLMIEALARLRVNRVSLGAQSLVDSEGRAVGRLHDRRTVLQDVQNLRQAGIENIGIDLIAGLPHQTLTTWKESMEAVLALQVPHVSVYMLEVDEDSRLGREVIAGGARYHAHHAPDEELTADLYAFACERLDRAGVLQYEISNFARPGFESRHNLKYWTRQPYTGFGLDAHSMLPALRMHSENLNSVAAVRFSTTDQLENYLESPRHESSCVKLQETMEEELFLGLRLNQGIAIREIASRLQVDIPDEYRRVLDSLVESRMLDIEIEDERYRLSAEGRLLSNEVFAEFIGVEANVGSRLL